MRSWTMARALSLDIVAGGLCGGLLAVHVTGASMPPVWWALLPSAIWVVYTLDHLMDARRVGASAGSQRHQVHARHFRLLSFLAASIGVSTGLAAFIWLPARLLVPGLLLAVAVALYLAGSQSRRAGAGWKEPAAGLLYAGGIWYGPVLESGESGLWVVLCLALFASAAILNLLLCSLFEIAIDREEGHASVALSWGSRHVERLVCGLALPGVGLAVACAAAGPDRLRAAFAILGILAAGPLLVLARPDWFRRGERYRVFGDLLFLLPALPLLFGRIA
ncbi:MAG: hypothetical protein IFK94_08255 [Acidobacteria bacterium]|uniref:Prenyltransferase n=1 Tax=Candidatus Polarisedimenticola svalbardensis TaxID=2886004 RepID=A0A8J6XUI4_9BACT|nr:hypothetical protein [Candidatus Polarisedimenticola svalbardensis]